MSKKRMKAPLVLDLHAIACKHTCKGQNIINNPWRACAAKVTVLGLCVCVCVHVCVCVCSL